MPVGVSAYVPLANVTLSSSAASVTFSGISQAYRDLVVIMRPQTNGFAAGPWLNFNNSTSTYSWVYAEGSGSATTSASNSDTYGGRINPENYISSANGDVVIMLNVFDYSATDKHKSWLSRYDSAGAGTGMLAGRWANTAAITSLKLDASRFGNVLTAGSTFALYGVSA